METILSLLLQCCGVGILLGVLFAGWMMIGALAWQKEQSEQYDLVQCDVTSKQMKRNAELQSILWDIRSTADDLREPLWKKFRELDVVNSRLEREERRALADLSGGLSDDAVLLIQGKEA